jgi:energy-coupling factor transporter ATP-binding protein EcfA2
MRIHRISIEGWRLIDQLDLDLDSHITILTGANNTGKSSVLQLLNVLLDPAPPHPPDRSVRSPTGTRTTAPTVVSAEPTSPTAATDHARPIGRVEFGSGDVVDLLPAAPSADALPVPRPTITVPGALISTNRTRAIGEPQPRSSDEEEERDGWTSRKAAAGYVDLVRQVLPTAAFDLVRRALPGGDEPHAAPPVHLGGLRPILDTLWQLHRLTAAETGRDVVVLLDEPELHLHPATQRELMPRLLAAVPNAQFIVATHSPFIVSAHPAARTYVLTATTNHRITARPADESATNGTVNDVLRAGLGLTSTLPVWVEQHLVELAGQMRGADLSSPEPIDALYRRLEMLGLQEYAPEILARILADRRGRNDSAA